MKYDLITGSAREVAKQVTHLMRTKDNFVLHELTSSISNSNNNLVYAQAVEYGYSSENVIVLTKASDYNSLEGLTYWLGSSIESVLNHADENDDNFLFTVDTDPTSIAPDKDRPACYAIIKGRIHHA